MVRLQLAVLSVFVGLLSVVPTRAEVVQHFNNGTAPGQFGAVSGLLDSVGIGWNNVSSETTATSFVVPGSGPIDLTFTFEADQGVFNFSFGFYLIDNVTADPVTNKRDYAVQALSVSNATLVFDDQTVNPITTATFPLDGGTRLGLFLIPDNTLAAFRANPDQFFPSQTDNNSLRSPLFSDSNANPGEFDQFLSFVANGVTLFTWEDLTRDGPTNNTFVDMAFSIDVPLTPVPEPSSIVILSMLSLGTLGSACFARRREARSVEQIAMLPR